MRRYYGACHGVAGNAGALLSGADLLPPEWTEIVLERTVQALTAGAAHNGDQINWPLSADASGTRMLVQWCHGAPGIVAAIGGVPRTGSTASEQLDRLLVKAGELVWKAGPVAKGPGICHGTAGNGYAFLALYCRTGEARWLERARRFAMHAIEQRRKHQSQYGQGRYTLWTGDGGLAVYLCHCLLQENGPTITPFPGLEAF